MFPRLVLICIFLTITACATGVPKEPPVQDVKKTPVREKRVAVKRTASDPEHKAVSAALQAQRQDRKYAFDAFDDTLIEILPDEILIVGRIKLSPLLEPEELDFRQEEMRNLRGKAIMVSSSTEEPLPEVADLDSAETFIATLDEDFLLTLPHEPFALLGGYVYIGDEDGQALEIMLPGSWQLGIRPTDRAIYIGTIHYVRSEYDTILDYIIEDDYPQAYKTYQHRLEEGVILRKELVRWGGWN
jgi:hypothetical protein